MAARTKRIKLGTSILLVNLRNPLILASTLSSLDYLSGGRVIAGVSLGGSLNEYETAGVQMKSRVTRFTETMATMRSLWGLGEDADTQKFFQAPIQNSAFRMAQRPIPVWIGGKVDAALERVATMGDGWLASSTTGPEEFAQGWTKIQRYARKLGRDPASLIPAKFTYIHVDDDRNRALEMLETRLPRYYDFSYDASSLAIYGPPEECVEKCQRLLNSGIRTLIFAMVTSDTEQLERLAKELLPHL